MIKNLRVDGQRSPIGIDCTAPRFSFDFDGGEHLFSVELLPADKRVAEQVRTISANDCKGFYFTERLRAGVRYRWQVSDGKETVSSQLETAADFAFSAIAPEKTPRTAPAFVRPIEIPASCISARLYLSCPSPCAVFLNGERVGKPFWGAASHFYICDLSPYLWHGAENTLRLLSADPNHAAVAAGIVTELENGTRSVIAADESWRVLESGILWDRAVNTEMLQIPPHDTHPIRVCRTAAPAFPASAAHTPQPSKRRILRPQLLYSREDGAILLDVGQSVTGFARLHARFAEERWVQFCFSDTPNEFSPSLSTFSFYAYPEKSVYEPVFARFSFRYLLAHNLSEAEAQNIEIVVE